MTSTDSAQSSVDLEALKRSIAEAKVTWDGSKPEDLGVLAWVLECQVQVAEVERLQTQFAAQTAVVDGLLDTLWAIADLPSTQYDKGPGMAWEAFKVENRRTKGAAFQKRAGARLAAADPPAEAQP